MAVAVSARPQPFSVAEEPNTAGKWVITPAEGGSVTILQDAGGTNYVITPSTGTAETVAIASVGELSLAAGSFSATVAALETVNGTEPVSGSGDITLTALEGDLDADLSVVATSGTKTVAVSEFGRNRLLRRGLGNELRSQRGHWVNPIDVRLHFGWPVYLRRRRRRNRG